MRRRTKALAAVGAIPLLFGRAAPVEALEPQTATRTFTFTRGGQQVSCTYSGFSQVELPSETGLLFTEIDAATRLVEGDPPCSTSGGAAVTVRFKRRDDGPFEQVRSGQTDVFSANVHLELDGPVVRVEVIHSASYACDSLRPCIGLFITNPK